MISAGIMAGCNRRIAAPLVVPVHDTIYTAVNRDHIFEDKPGIPDSASIKALLQCDSLGNVYLRTITQLQGEIVSQALQLEDNILKVEAKSKTSEKKETIKQDSVRIEYKEKPVPYPVETITNELTSWQSFQIWTGRIALVLIVGWLGCSVYMGIRLNGDKFNFITKLFKKH